MKSKSSANKSLYFIHMGVCFSVVALPAVYSVQSYYVLNRTITYTRAMPNEFVMGMTKAVLVLE